MPLYTKLPFVKKHAAQRVADLKHLYLPTQETSHVSQQASAERLNVQSAQRYHERAVGEQLETKTKEIQMVYSACKTRSQRTL